MTDETIIVAITLVVYKLILIGIGFWASARNQNETDFFLGGRKLGPLVAAISYSSSASSAWTLLGVSGAAYVLGISVVWIASGSLTGMLGAWCWIGPWLRERSRERAHITFTDFIAEGMVGRSRRSIVGIASLIIVFSFTFYVAAQLQGAGNTFASTFGFSMASSIVLGAVIIMVYTLLGGFWAVSVTDTLQGGLMGFTAILVPVVAVMEASGHSDPAFWLRAELEPAPAHAVP